MKAIQHRCYFTRNKRYYMLRIKAKCKIHLLDAQLSRDYSGVEPLFWLFFRINISTKKFISLSFPQPY
ncbi:MAG: hypothetical protein ACRDBM_00605 [Sporomusa sp.]